MRLPYFVLHWDAATRDLGPVRAPPRAGGPAESDADPLKYGAQDEGKSWFTIEAIFAQTLGNEFAVRLESGPGVGRLTSRRAAATAAFDISFTQVASRVVKQSPLSFCARRKVLVLKGSIQK
jgi:hypothetical protein